MRRRLLMGLLGLGVIFGYGGALASAGWHAHHRHCEGWGRHRGDSAEVAAPATAPAPQTVVVQPAAVSPAPAPQVFIIMPGAPASPQVVQVPGVATAPAATH